MPVCGPSSGIVTPTEQALDRLIDFGSADPNKIEIRDASKTHFLYAVVCVRFRSVIRAFLRSVEPVLRSGVAAGSTNG